LLRDMFNVVVSLPSIVTSVRLQAYSASVTFGLAATCVATYPALIADCHIGSYRKSFNIYVLNGLKFHLYGTHK
jgi:hypothetical protein